MLFSQISFKIVFPFSFNVEHSVCMLNSLVSDCFQLFATLWTIACQAPLSTGFPRQAYWNGLPFPSPGDASDPRMEPISPVLAGGFFTTKPPGKSNSYPISPQNSLSSS